MKIGVTIDCTPEEARAFFGLPDVQPMQAKVMEQIEQQMLDATKAFSAESVLKGWLSLVPPNSAEQFWRMVANQFKPPSTPS